MALAGNQFFNGGIYAPPFGGDCDFFGDGSGKLLFRFDNDLTDTCGNYNNNYQNSSQSYSTDSKFGEYSFGPASWINTYSRNGLNSGILGTRSSASVWVKSAAWNSGVIFEVDNFRLLMAGSGVQGGYGIGSGNSGWNPPAVTHGMAVNEWNHIALVASGGIATLNFYINGVLIHTVSNGSNPPRAPYKVPFNIGSNSVNFLKFNGQIDQLRFFNKTLSASEVTALYNES